MSADPVPRPSRSFAEHLADRDAARFSGRSDELAMFEEVLSDDPSASIVFVHGRGGIGKSALLREVARRAHRRGFLVALLDGRTVAGSPEEVDRAVEHLRDAALPLLIIDSYERAEAIGAHVREHILPVLSAETRLVIGSRNRPDPGWFGSGWDSVTRSIELTPLSAGESRLALSRLGLTQDKAIDRIVAWARGEPLALVVGAEAPERVAQGSDAELGDVLAERLVGDEAQSVDRRVLAVAAIAPAIDRRLIAAVVDDVDATDALGRVRGLSFAEDLGDRVTLHDRVRWALHACLVRDEPATEREVRRRLADHFHERASEGDTRFLLEFGSLFSDPALRWGWAADSRGKYRVGAARPGDEADAASALGVGDAVWWRGISRWFREAAHTITTVRDVSGRLAGFCIFVTPETAPPWAWGDVVLGPRLQHAAHRYPEGNVVLWRDAFGFPRSGDADAAQPFMLAVQGGIIASGRYDSIATYGSVIVGDQVSTALADAYGAIPEGELRVVDGERVVEGRIVHHGHGGFIGAARALVYRDLGLAPPGPGPAEIRRGVRSALKDYHDPLALAANPLAEGDTPQARAEYVRRLIMEAIEAAFGETPSQRTTRAVLESGYLEAGRTHEAAARSLHLGRSTYFRYLTHGVERIAHYVADRRGER